MAVNYILTMNRGSSTLKAAIYQADARAEQVLSIKVDRADRAGSQITIKDRQGRVLLNLAASKDPGDGSSAVLAPIFDWLDEHDYLSSLTAAGHRLVHGGLRFQKPQRITPDILAELERLVALDPDHLPAAIAGIRFLTGRLPKLPQIVCFDTAFHDSLPKLARMYALPRRFFGDGIMRFGFHGLSYEYIFRELSTLDGQLANGRAIVAHLGSGASMVATKGGKSVDTSMGFTPLEGLVMGTRCGDLDPGILLYILERDKMSTAELSRCLNQQSGLLGVSASSEDMRDLLESAPHDANAAEAVELFCYRAKKYVGAYSAALGGLDLLVFSGGIGEKAAPVRQKICDGLEFLGIEIDRERNQANSPVISSAASRVKVRVIETNEDLTIVRHVLDLLGQA